MSGTGRVKTESVAMNSEPPVTWEYDIRNRNSAILVVEYNRGRPYALSPEGLTEASKGASAAIEGPWK